MRPALSPEPVFWSALLVALLATPLLISGAEADGADPHLHATAVVLSGVASSGFGAALLLGAYGRVRLRRTLIVMAASGAILGGVFIAFLSADLNGLLGAYCFFVVIVDGWGVAVLPRAWRGAATPLRADAAA